MEMDMNGMLLSFFVLFDFTTVPLLKPTTI